MMLGFPISTFYFSFYVLFKADQAMLGWSGLLAVVAANIVIAAYVLMAWQEDQADQALEAKKRLQESTQDADLLATNKPPSSSKPKTL